MHHRPEATGHINGMLDSTGLHKIHKQSLELLARTTQEIAHEQASEKYKEPSRGSARNAMSSVAFIGIGNMGAFLAKTLFKTISYIVSLWNRTAHRPQVKAVVDGGAAFEPTTSSSSAWSITASSIVSWNRSAWEMQEWIKARGAGYYFDGAVMIPPQLVGTEHAFFLYSGEAEESFTKNAAHVVSSLGFAQYTAPNLNPAAAALPHHKKQWFILDLMPT
ncbi:hypothetical protein MHUMG1_06610 [Metarhizium humberi]|uniref:6-phosphogluconate dehydrogenase NADP-binding domain-containing protein n=1 Tax=Metarhizium humberi TaxID=2596975 RepID=A0A9P8MB99_9HYPO|nr:hypothetical protein MHUMG1_06610 [Metarhizium humberi]